MPSFKELMQAFLYEDVTEEDDDEEDYIVSQPVSSTVSSKPVQDAAYTPAPEAVTARPEADIPAYKPAESAPAAAPAADIPPISEAAAISPQPQKSSFLNSLNMDVDAVSRPEEKQSAKERKVREPYHYNRQKIAKPMRRTPEYEYESVISPIFGNMEDDEKQFDAVHDAVNLPRPTEELEITSVISPMFGNGKTALNMDEIPEYQPRAKKKKAAPARDENRLPRENTQTSSRPIRDVADLLTREPVSAPASENETQSEQLSLENKD